MSKNMRKNNENKNLEEERKFNELVNNLLEVNGVIVNENSLSEFNLISNLIIRIEENNFLDKLNRINKILFENYEIYEFSLNMEFRGDNEILLKYSLYIDSFYYK